MNLETLLREPGFRELLTRFADALPSRAEEIRAAAEEGDLASVKTLAHRLKGAGGSYGFEEITSHAMLVERFASEADLGRLQKAVEGLARACFEATQLVGQ